MSEDNKKVAFFSIPDATIEELNGFLETLEKLDFPFKVMILNRDMKSISKEDLVNVCEQILEDLK